MHLTSMEYLRWSAGAGLEVVVCFLVFRRGLARRLPTFAAYLALLLAAEAVYGLAQTAVGSGSRVLFPIYWATQAALITARAAVVFEICWQVLRPYQGIWILGRPILIGIGSILVVTAVYQAGQSKPWISAVVLTAERGLELAISGVLLFALAFCRYYGVEVEPPLKWIALGLGFYSFVQVANNSIMREWPLGLSSFWYASFWSWIRLSSFNMVSLLWLLALWKPLKALHPAPVLLDRETYDELSPQVTVRMRELNSRLLEMLK